MNVYIAMYEYMRMRECVCLCACEDSSIKTYRETRNGVQTPAKI